MISSKRRGSSPAELADGVLARKRLSIAQAISLMENESDEAHRLLRLLFAHGGHAGIVGITGAPGTGKSTLVTALARAYRRAGLTIGVVAVDPSSPFSGGALLGDRVRMGTLSGDPGIFIRSMATRGSLGGLSRTTGDAVAILDAAGFDRVLVETVGVGQAEVEIAAAAHTTLVVEAPGLGDEVQAIKAGVLEIADLLVVNKADRAGVDETVRALRLALTGEGDRRRQTTAPHWGVDVLTTIAAQDVGVEELRQRIESHREWLRSSDEWDRRERLRAAHRIEAIVQAELRRRTAAVLTGAAVAALVDAVQTRQLDPYSAAQIIIESAASA